MNKNNKQLLDQVEQNIGICQCLGDQFFAEGQLLLTASVTYNLRGKRSEGRKKNASNYNSFCSSGLVSAQVASSMPSCAIFVICKVCVNFVPRGCFK